MPIILLFLIVISNAFALEFELGSPQTLYIIDGDSMNIKMRIYGIDTPEMKQECRLHRQEIINCGVIAQEYLRTLLHTIEGKITIEVVTVDIYKRLLVNVYKGDVDIARLMVRDGMAFAYGSKYKAEEEYAKSKKLGFWGYYTPPLLPRIWRKKYM